MSKKSVRYWSDMKKRFHWPKKAREPQSPKEHSLLNDDGLWIDGPADPLYRLRQIGTEEENLELPLE